MPRNLHTRSLSPAEHTSDEQLLLPLLTFKFEAAPEIHGSLSGCDRVGLQLLESDLEAARLGISPAVAWTHHAQPNHPRDL